MATVWQWSGNEVRALREAQRMSIREFAAHLGVSDRMVSKWEAGGAHIHPRPVNQAALDTSLARLSTDARARFARFADLTRDGRSTANGERLHHPVDGKWMVPVPGGRTEAREPDWLTAYYIDVYPTTNGDYARFVAATGHEPPPHWSHGDPPPERFDHPVVFVTWHDAQAYAGWAGKLLPTRAQFRRAAGPRTYPWGDDPAAASCNVRDDRIGGTTPVGDYPHGASPFGVHDLCGNVWEWCATETAPARYALIGGAFTTTLECAAPSVHHDAPASMRDGDIGFRCVAVDLR